MTVPHLTKGQIEDKKDLKKTLLSCCTRCRKRKTWFLPSEIMSVIA
jgi:hypothetical protein